MAISTFSDVELDGSDDLAGDGAIITIRPIRPEDRSGLLGLCRDAGADSRTRFAGTAAATVTPADIDDLCSTRSGEHLTLVGLDGAGIAGAAHCVRSPHTSTSGQITVLVAGPHRGRGIGTLLLDHLVTRARRAGITRLLADEPASPDRDSAGSAPTTRTTSDTGGNGLDAVRRAVEAHDRSAAQLSLRAMFAPRSVAVVGALQRRGATGFETLRALKDYGFRGHLYPVNGSGRPVCGIPGRRTLADVPGPVDLLIVAETTDRVAPVIREAAARGTRAVAVLTRVTCSAPGARALHRDLRDLTERYGLRIIGPNSIGLLNTDPPSRLNASVSPVRPHVGGLSLATRSADVGIALLEHTARNGCGVATFLCLGDHTDITTEDLITYWYSDPRTRAVAVHLDSFDDSRTFARTVRALSRRKPVLAISSHRAHPPAATGALSATAADRDALRHRTGIIEVAGLDEMTDTARLLTDQPLPRGGRLGIIGNAGGLTDLAATTAHSLGLTVPSFSADLTRELTGNPDNPVDLGADATARQIADTAETVARSGEIDMLLGMVVGTRTNNPTAIMATLSTVLDNHPHLTAAVVLTGSADDLHRLGSRNTPVYRQYDRALHALAKAHHYMTWRLEPLGRRANLGGIEPGAAHHLIERARTDGQGLVPRSTAVDILAAYGITVLTAAHASTGVGAVAAAERLGYPVVLAPADIPARTASPPCELATAAAVREAFTAVAHHGGPDAGVLVQHRLTAPIQLSATITQLPGHGPVIRLELGDDQATCAIPLTDLDATRLWHRLSRASARCRPVNPAGIEDLALRLSALADDHPEIARLDLCPVLAGPNGVVATQVRLQLTT